MITTDELRKRFLEFFKSKDHKIYSSDTLVPKDDPTLLFTSAGMNQFKQEFLGKATDFKRRATCQRCLRTADLDRVGKTNSHHTFFEMLGNFSFGDYFKPEAIQWAWEFVTEWLSLPPQRLWVSVYRDDQQAYQIWRDKVAVASERIVKLGAEDNFWPANAPEDGPDGPCGSCSEIFYDQTQKCNQGRAECSPACDCGRFVEVWNLVFTQFDRQGKNNLLPLPNKNIDTGMGLERMAAVLQGVANNFEIDIFKPIVRQIADFAKGSAQVRTCYTIADHIRAVTFAIFDGILPSNDDRGYVIRKLIRRAVWHGQAQGIRKNFLYRVVPTVCHQMQAALPELVSKREEIARVVLAEEQRFQNTLQRAQAYAQEVVQELTLQGKTKIPGEIAFKLYDTYGLPLEMFEDIISAEGFQLDQAGFQQQLQQQRQSSRSSSNLEAAVFVGTLASKFKLLATDFIGEQQLSAPVKVIALFKNDQPVTQAQSGDEVKIVLDQTPFYGESGGQVGDTGVIRGKDTLLEVYDTHKLDQTIIHLVRIKQGEVKVGQGLQAQVDVHRREKIACNHTATHLLQAALRMVLGAHVRQSGSWVGPDRLRFDFSHFQALSPQQLARVEEIVNDQIKQARQLKIIQMDFEQAKQQGALAFFGEKYQENVRVVKIGDISAELCGGIHVCCTGQIQRFKIISESSVASGIRRIEALTYDQAAELVKQENQQLDELAQLFGLGQEQLAEGIQQYPLKLKELSRRMEQARVNSFKADIGKIISQAQESQGVKIIAQEIKAADMKLLRLMSDELRQKASDSLVVLGSVWEEKPILICALNGNRRPHGLDAVGVIRLIAQEIDGTGGGRPEFAQAGGRKPEGLSRALAKVKEILKGELAK